MQQTGKVHNTKEAVTSLLQTHPLHVFNGKKTKGKIMWIMLYYFTISKTEWAALEKKVKSHIMPYL